MRTFCLVACLALSIYGIFLDRTEESSSYAAAALIILAMDKKGGAQ